MLQFVWRTAAGFARHDPHLNSDKIVTPPPTLYCSTLSSLHLPHSPTHTTLRQSFEKKNDEKEQKKVYRLGHNASLPNPCWRTNHTPPPLKTGNMEGVVTRGRGGKEEEGRRQGHERHAQAHD